MLNITRKHLKIQRNKKNFPMKKTAFYQLEKHLEPIFTNAIEKEFFSGAVAAISFYKKGVKKRLIKSYGRTRNDEKGEKVTAGTVFDLASLTKPLCTTLCVLSLIENCKIKWTSELKSLIKDKTAPYLKKIKIEQLLSYSSGLKDYKPFFNDYEAKYSEKSKKQIIKKILLEPLVYEPGKKYLYSDLGFMLLGEIIEKVSGKELDRYFTEKIIRPLQLEKSIFFRPFSIVAEKYEKKYAATEICPWRNRLLQGEVHDEHCWLIGGVAGHAGLFGTIGGVLSLTEHILDQWQGRSNHPSYSNVLLQHALNKKYPGETWGMGFDRPSAQGSSAGKYLSASSIGHLGYTGTSFWIDPERELVVVLLTNRVHPTRKNEQIKEFRPLFHNTVIEKLDSK